MALSAPIVAAIDRLKNFYNGLAYNAATNPGGMGNGGNRRNFEPALKDLADVAGAITADTEASRVDTAASKAAAAQSVTQAAAQVTLAAEQVALAAGQVALASTQAERAEAEADRATDRASAAAGSAAAAAQSANAASAASGLPVIAGPEDAGKAITVNAVGSRFELAGGANHSFNLATGVI